MQTGQYSTQIFSLAVLLSSLFIYNQMGGIDEAALDRLSLVTEMTKHIRVRSEGAAGVRMHVLRPRLSSPQRAGLHVCEASGLSRVSEAAKPNSMRSHEALTGGIR